MSPLSSTEQSEFATQPQPLSVGQLTEQIKGLLEGTFPSVWVTGEISNFARPQSGHCYFTLKDEDAQIRAVMWRGTAAKLRFDVADGLEVICRGQIDVYAPRGSYQLVVQKIEPKGVGALELALRRLREKLAAEGLFDQELKRPLPKFPRRIAFVTSPTGAAIRDFLEVLRRRWSGVDVLVVPTRVQGDGAADEIAAAIELVQQVRPAVDVIVVGRGGGSLEDLWAFNEEPVVRAIAGSILPVVSAVGHEIDVTLSDLAADVRALTPSEAAELVVPAADEFQIRLRSHGQRLHLAMRGVVDQLSYRVETAAQSRPLRRPYDLIHDLARQVDELSSRANRTIWQNHQTSSSKLRELTGRLESLSPLAVLSRGYSVTQRASDRQVLRGSDEIAVGDTIQTRLATGRLTSQVTTVESDNRDEKQARKSKFRANKKTHKKGDSSG